MTKTYGIPGVISTSELFYFNNRHGKLRIQFDGGIPDPKIAKPATYTTESEFDQRIIESSPLFGTRIFRYTLNGKLVTELSNFDAEKAPTTADVQPKTKKVAKKASEALSGVMVREDVHSLGEATEALLEMGVPASDLQGKDAVLSAMLTMRVAFPNMELDK